MKTLSIYALALCGLLLTFASCSDKKDDPAPSKSRKELIIGKWQITAATVNPGVTFTPGGPVITDFYAQFDACGKDDIVEFLSGGAFVFDEGATKCDPDDDQTSVGTWLMSGDEKQLTITEDGKSDITIIESLSATQMVLSFESNDWDDGIKRKQTTTFTKK